MIWFNPQYSSNVKTDIGKIFLYLLLKHFPVNNKKYETFKIKKSKI